MGGKGSRRREKNYRAAHGGYSALPPPPDPSQVDALPSKLRRIISFTSSPQSQPEALTKNIETRKKREDGHAQNDKDKVGKKAYVKHGGTDGELEASRHTGSGNEQFIQSNASEKKKNKRKRKQVKDLRFEEVEKTSSELKRRERKKKYLEAKKKQKKTKTEESLESLEFPGREQIKFGDIVEAPPKLAIIPKAFKNAQDASQERLRLKAIEAYRSRKGWTSRPGSQLLPPMTTSTTP